MHSPVPGGSTAPLSTGTGIASWYVPGRHDGFGDRLLMFDNAGTPSLELLRFNPALSSNPGFEHYLRERVQQLSGFRHPAFAAARRVQHLGEGEGLALVSAHAEGQPLSALIARRRGEGMDARSVTALLAELLQALGALHEAGPDIAHGAITPDRLVVSTDGRLQILEPVLGSALQHLSLEPAQLWQDFGLVSGTGASPAAVNAQSDLLQAAAITLSMLLARPVTQSDLERHLPALLDEASQPSSRSSAAPSPLRRWLEGALGVNGSGYATAGEAQRRLHDLSTSPHAHVAVGGSTGDTTSVATRPDGARGRTYPSVEELTTLTNFPSERPRAVVSEPVPLEPPRTPAHATSTSFTFEFVSAPPPDTREPPPAAVRRVVSARLALSLAALAVVEAAVIALLAWRVLMP